MTRSVYVVGGAGTGKSTFTGALLGEELCLPLGPLVDLASKANARGNLVTLRGHFLGGDQGVYLGVDRPVHPGTDGLDRASSIAGEVWLDAGSLPPMVVAEGATLATTRFITALCRTTKLLLVHLTASPETVVSRFAQRGTTQQDSFVTATRTRSARVRDLAADAGATVVSVDTEDPTAWQVSLELSTAWLNA